MKNTSTIRACAISALVCLTLTCGGPAWALDGKGGVGMDAKAFLAECEKGVEFWCSNQIYGVAINANLEHMAKNEPATFCIPKRGAGTAAERNAKVVAGVKGWFARHPEAVAQEGDASVSILKALVALWPGACAA